MRWLTSCLDSAIIIRYTTLKKSELSDHKGISISLGRNYSCEDKNMDYTVLFFYVWHRMNIFKIFVYQQEGDHKTLHGEFDLYTFLYLTYYINFIVLLQLEDNVCCVVLCNFTNYLLLFLSFICTYLFNNWLIYWLVDWLIHLRYFQVNPTVTWCNGVCVIRYSQLLLLNLFGIQWFTTRESLSDISVYSRV